MNITVNSVHTKYINNARSVSRQTVNHIINNLFHDSDYKIVISDIGKDLLEKDLQRVRTQQEDNWDLYCKDIFL